jgi:hypothetical protein
MDPVSDPDAAPDPALFVSDLKTPTKNEQINFFTKLFCLFLFALRSRIRMQIRSLVSTVIRWC